MQLFTKIASNTLWQIVARIFSSGVSFAITIIIARTLGVNGYGDLAKITAFVSLFYLLIDLGLNAIFLQMEEHEKRFRDLLYFRLLLAFCLFFLVSIIAFTLPYSGVSGIGYSPLVKLGIILFGFTFFGRAISFSASVIFQKKYVYRFGTYASVAGSLVTFLSVILALFFHASFLVIVSTYVIGTFAEAVLALALVKEVLFPVSLNIRFIKNLFFQTVPITMMLLLNLIYFRVDMLFLSVMKSTHDVAIYDFAYKFFDFLIALPLFLSNSIYPALLATEKNTRIVIPKLLLYTIAFALLGIFVTIPVWVASPFLSLVKPEFLESSFALRLLLLSLPIFFATNILQWIFIAKKKQKFLLFVYGGSLLSNVVLNLLFIPHFSYVASAIITGVSEAGVLGALLLYSFFKSL